MWRVALPSSDALDNKKLRNSVLLSSSLHLMSSKMLIIALLKVFRLKQCWFKQIKMKINTYLAISASMLLLAVSCYMTVINPYAM